MGDRSVHEYSRREILRAFALGGAVVAGELWIPGQRLISIPKYPIDPQIPLYGVTPQKVSAIMTRAEFRELMQSSLNEAFDEVYADRRDPFDDKWAAIKITLDEESSQISMKGITHEEMYVA